VPARGDRFVIRRVSPPDTLGGGCVVDSRPRRHGPGTEHAKRLAALASRDPLARLAVALDEARSGLSPADGEPGLLERLRAEGRATPVGARSERWFSPPRLVEARGHIADSLRRAGGRPASRDALARAAGLEEDGAGAILDTLVAEGVARPLGAGFVAAGHGPAREDPTGARVLAALEEDGLEPRAPDVLAAALDVDSGIAREALARLALEDSVVRVAPGLYYHPTWLEAARGRVVELCRRDGAVTIAGLRDELGTSRKYAQALLEHFDAARLTRRRGDEHVLRPG
jgi:selenocysteine-specific elongation factor